MSWQRPTQDFERIMSTGQERRKVIERQVRFAERLAVVWTLLFLSLALGGIGTLIYVAVHFLAKVW